MRIEFQTQEIEVAGSHGNERLTVLPFPSGGVNIAQYDKVGASVVIVRPAQVQPLIRILQEHAANTTSRRHFEIKQRLDELRAEVAELEKQLV